MNEPQENTYNSFDIFMELESSSLKKGIDLINKYDGKTQRRIIYGVIHDNFFENVDNFTSDFLKTFIQFANVMQFLLKDTNNKITS